MSAIIHETHLKDLHLRHRGKVRDIYDVDAKHLLIVATDRLSAFDVILPDPIPNKGSVLTQLIACLAVLSYSLVMTGVVLWITSRVARLRVHEVDERFTTTEALSSGAADVDAAAAALILDQFFRTLEDDVET